eukprot:5763553-Prymnesium_polylepis.2
MRQPCAPRDMCSRASRGATRLLGRAGPALVGLSRRQGGRGRWARPCERALRATARVSGVHAAADGDKHTSRVKTESEKH